MLSLFGFAFSNSLFPGKFASLDYLPECKEAGYDKSSYKDMLTWEYLTRRDDLQAKHDDNSSMIANFEVIKSGVTFHGGIDYNDNITEIEKHCLHHGINLMKKSGRLGAAANRGWGFVEIKTEEELPVDKYLKFIEQNKDRILQFIKNMNGLNEKKIESADLFEVGDISC